MKIRCFDCKEVVSVVPDGTIFRGTARCPECEYKNDTVVTDSMTSSELEYHRKEHQEKSSMAGETK